MPKPPKERPDARPLRIPDGVPIGTVSPPHMEVDTIGTWRLALRTRGDVEGERLVLWLGGHRWVKLDLCCQNVDPRAEGYVSASVNGGNPLAPASMPAPSRIHELMRVTFQVPPQGIPGGSELRFTLGDTSGGSPGLRGPSSTVRNVFLALTLEPKPPDLGDHELNFLGAFVLDLIGGPLTNLHALAPSSVEPGQPFTLFVRPQDRSGCVSPEKPRSLLLTIAGRTRKVVVEQDMLNQAGVVEIRDLEIGRKGVSTIHVRDPDRGLEVRSNPILAGNQTEKLLWGVVHEHTEISDGSGSLDLCYQNMRYGSRLDFGAASDHDHRFETTDEMWEMTREAARRHNDPGRFTTLLGYEWAKWRRNGDGDRNVYYPSDKGDMYRSETGEYDNPPRLFRALCDQEAIIIPHHTAYSGNFCDWKDHDPEKERLVEIYSVWGSSEMSASEGNPLPVRTARDFDPRWIAASGKTPGLAEEPVGFVQNALAKGWRVGFTAGGDMHRSHPGDDVRRGFPPYEYKAGLTAVWAADNVRSHVYESLKKRRCYATTGSRMILQMTVNGHPMGSELAAGAGPRRIEFRGIGETRIATVEILRNNVVLEAESVGKRRVNLNWLDADDFKAVALPASQWSEKAFIFYYARVAQEDGEMGWTSPVWMVER